MGTRRSAQADPAHRPHSSDHGPATPAVNPEHLSKDPSEAARTAEAWTQCARVMEQHHKGLVKRWKDEIDTLLVYAGLFSAVLTAFNVELYVSLQPNPTDTTNALLAQVSAQLNSLALGANYTHPLIAPPSPSAFRASASAVWINALWFSSLICSLSSAFIGMMVKQWLHESEIGLFGTSRNAMRLRQYRIDSLEKWRVSTIVAVLPVFLQVASILFLAGLLILLWTLHPIVAGLASGLVGTLLAFTAVTLIVPAFSEDCAYRSPQALDVFIVVQGFYHALRSLRATVHWAISNQQNFRDNWVLYRLISFLRFLFGRTRAENIYGSSRLMWGTFHGWAGMEHSVVDSRGDHLDARTVTAAQLVVLDAAFTSDVSVTCALSLPGFHSTWCLYELAWNLERHMGGRRIVDHPFGRRGARKAGRYGSARNMAIAARIARNSRLIVSNPSEDYVHFSLVLSDLALRWSFFNPAQDNGDVLLSIPQYLHVLFDYGPAVASKLTEDQLATVGLLFKQSMEVEAVEGAPNAGANLAFFQYSTFRALHHLLVHPDVIPSSDPDRVPADGVDWHRILRRGSAATWPVLGALMILVGSETSWLELTPNTWPYVRYLAFLSLIDILGISNLQYSSHEDFVRESGDQYARLQRTVDGYMSSLAAPHGQLRRCLELWLRRTENAVNMLARLREQRPSCHLIFERFEQLVAEELRRGLGQQPYFGEDTSCASRVLERLQSGLAGSHA
ncbi:hypothetical protein PYCCODRAFT_1434974 [Trametes coccinea BRFM310]|uniref:DUF6535 domain-containing protein n=1 Tax=Trametes coccinea (strain BRFM310) TaxID=1353009 RepID=A0A1Y2IPQ1_TRAC3|nr:hypothetical protein PYCCODRAFT_1434974 [Trametes coccinea BRFM310]